MARVGELAREQVLARVVVQQVLAKVQVRVREPLR